MKKLVALATAVILLVGLVPFSASAKELEVEVNGFDCTRDAGKLIVYTDEYGEKTGTNEWGVEAIVGSDNRVISVVKGNATIPEDGFVVSGHDNDQQGGKKMKTWINENIEVGDYVYVDKRSSMLKVSDKELPKESPFFSFDNEANGVDVLRGTDDMILYTPAYGKTTGTNEYGYEVVVEDGIITKLGGNNSTIPENGYVISLQGSTARWMRLKIVRGMEVEYFPDTSNVVFTYSAAGIEKAMAYTLDSVQTAIDEAKRNFVYADYAAAEATLAALKGQYQTVLAAFKENGDENDFADDCDDLFEDIDELKCSLCDSYPVQYRGVWIRPTQKSKSQVEKYVKELHEASINFVCVEGWFENGVIMDVPEDSLFKKHASFKFDVLEAYVDACHKYGMECHLWMPILNVGSMNVDGYEENTVPGQKPEWLSLNNNGKAYNDNWFMMLDPANQEACDYLLEFYRYIVTTYDIDCFEMDYIRYYAANAEADFGYTEAAFAGFEKAYGYGVTPEYDKEAAYWDDWCQYRRDCVTELVRSIREMIDKEAPDMLLAADVAFPFEHALDVVYQDFPSWLEEGLIDILHPMAYGDGYGEEICKAVELAGSRCMVVTGLGAQTDFLGAEELERQAREDNLYGAYGDCFFEATTYFSDNVPEAAMQTVYRNEAIPPFLDTTLSVQTMLDYAVGRIDDVIVPLGGMTEAEATSVKTAIEAAKASVTDGKIEKTKLATLQAAIDAVANEQARKVLTSDLYRAQYIDSVKNPVIKSNQQKPTVQVKKPQVPAPTSGVTNVSSTLLIVVAVVLSVLAVGVVVVLCVIMAKKPKTKDE